MRVRIFLYIIPNCALVGIFRCCVQILNSEGKVEFEWNEGKKDEFEWERRVNVPTQKLNSTFPTLKAEFDF
jgi:hypothetical protein